MDFQSGSPVISYTGLSNGYEGIAHMEDGAGNIIFFVNANGVYNSAQVLMSGSVGLLADPSSAEIDICPWPKHAGKFFIIYNAQTCSNMFYSVVDMNLNGGLGNVSSLNIPLNQSSVAEGFEIVRADCNLYRVLFYNCNVGFKSFDVDSIGIHNPTLLLTYPNPQNGTDGRGELDYANGRIGMGFNNIDYAFLGDYDPLTNVLSNPVTVHVGTNTANGTYGIEFSPDGTKAYISCWYDLSSNNNLYQYDFTSGTLLGFFVNSISVSGGEHGPGQIELGSDNNLYMINNGSHEITVISNANSTTPTFTTINVTSTLALGISDAIQTDVFFTFDFTSTFSCTGPTVNFNSTGNTCQVDSIGWNFGDGTHGAGQNPSHTYSLAGNFTIHMYVYFAGMIDSVSHPIIITSNMLNGFSVDAGPNQTIDVAGSALLNATINVSGNYIYSWTPTINLSDPTILNPIANPTQTTTYYITVTNSAGCSTTDSVIVNVVPTIFVPDAFSPNGDGNNDVFEIMNPQLASTFSINIFNRWGELIFKSNDAYFKWDGAYQNVQQEIDTYVYVIFFSQQSNSTSRMLKGNVTLVR